MKMLEAMNPTAFPSVQATRRDGTITGSCISASIPRIRWVSMISGRILALLLFHPQATPEPAVGSTRSETLAPQMRILRFLAEAFPAFLQGSLEIVA